MAEGTRQPDWLGRGVGLAVFAAGIVLLVLVFIWSGQLPQPPPVADPKVYGHWSLGLGVQVARLFVAGLVASWIAGRGAQLYAAANRALSGD